jgi:XTP/dITP diphosphohydrolase
MRVVLATRNAAKLEEITAIVGAEAEVLGLDAFGVVELLPEDGATYEENALTKGRAVARALGLAALADDSGLEVAALGGAPGVRSSRYAGPACDPQANNEKLLRELAAVPPERKQACFVCVAALVTPAGGEWFTRGEVAGRIAAAPRGDGGFGYDPVFVPAGYERTFAEMAAEEKNRLSHRARAFSKIKKYLRETNSL